MAIFFAASSETILPMRTLQASFSLEQVAHCQTLASQMGFVNGSVSVRLLVVVQRGKVRSTYKTRSLFLYCYTPNGSYLFIVNETCLTKTQNCLYSNTCE